METYFVPCAFGSRYIEITPTPENINDMQAKVGILLTAGSECESLATELIKRPTVMHKHVETCAIHACS